MALPTTAAEIDLMMQVGDFQIKVWAERIDNQIMRELELVEQKHHPDWRPPPMRVRLSTVKIRHPPKFTLRSSASSKNST